MTEGWPPWSRPLIPFGVALAATLAGTYWVSQTDLCTAGGRWMLLAWLAAVVGLGLTSFALGRLASTRVLRGSLYLLGGITFAFLLFGIVLGFGMADFCANWF